MHAPDPPSDTNLRRYMVPYFSVSRGDNRSQSKRRQSRGARGHMEYTPQELMVAAAAREIRDGEVVFVGMRLPLIAYALARETHAPSAVGLFECGIVRGAPSPELLY